MVRGQFLHLTRELGRDRKKTSRKKKGTDFRDGSLTVRETTSRKRRNNTLKAAEEIHGGSKRSASVGLIDTVLRRCSQKLVTEMFMESEISKKNESELKTYESSNENMCRSVAVYYSGGVTGKRKYRKLYRDSAYKVNNKMTHTTRISIASCPVPR